MIDPRDARNVAHRTRGRRRLGPVYLGFVLLMVFNVAIPKAGIAVAGVPVTFGYMLLSLLVIPATFGLFRSPPLNMAPLLQLGFGFMPLGIMTLHKVLLYSTSVSLVINGTLFIMLPLLVLLVIAPYLERLSEREITQVLTWTVRFAVVWGIMNFVLYVVAKQFIEIPYLTVNAADVGEIFGKNNRRGSLMKLVSTYNNGNVFGAAAVMLAPLYLLLEKSPRWKAAFCLAVVLTLSRSAWFGLVGVFGTLVVIGQIKLTRTSSWLLLGCGVGCVVLLLPYMGWNSGNIVDSNLGGRLNQVDRLDWSLFGGQGVHITEIVYAGLLQSFGIAGTGIALVALGFPIAYGVQAWPRLTPIRRAAVASVFCYLLIAASDGAFILAPIMLQFLFVTAMVYRRGYRAANSHPEAPGRLPYRAFVRAGATAR